MAHQIGMNKMVDQTPELSLVIPCYNEQTSLRHTVSGFVQAFENEGINLQLVIAANESKWKFE